MVPNWFWLLTVLPVLVLAGILRSAWFRGKLGEFKVNVGATLFLDRKTYRLVKNVTLPVGGKTTQIDHLIVSPYGLFVIETKNMKGWIYGQSNRAQWTQVIYRFKRTFQNPLSQNNIHVRALRDLLGLGPEQVHNVVVFVGTCTFKTPMPVNVVQGVFSLLNFIRAKRDLVFTDDEVSRFIDDILNKRLDPGFRTERTHARNVKRRISDNATTSRAACPRCGSVMVERRNRRTGERFLGCRRFPQCRGARDLS